MIDPDQCETDAIIQLDNTLGVMGMAPYDFFAKQLKKKIEIIGCLMDSGVEVDYSAHLSNNINNFVNSEETSYIYTNIQTCKQTC